MTCTLKNISFLTIKNRLIIGITAAKIFAILIFLFLLFFLSVKLNAQTLTPGDRTSRCSGVLLPAPTVLGPLSLCVGTSGTYIASPSGQPFYQFSFSGGGASINSFVTNTINVTWSTGGIKTIEVYYKDEDGCFSAITTITITVTPKVTPTFTQIAPLCQNSTAPTLPTTSNNNITGTWSPATINTATTASPVYTFTPNGQCATTATMSITVDPLITPTFTQIAALCPNSTAPILPATSNNNIAGTWSPSSINTSATGTTTYTFTPSSGCAMTATMDITINTGVAPTFTQIASLCQNSTAPTLPTTSNNNITGTWSPATINTATAASTVYTFTPNAGQCATKAIMSITVNPRVTPAFTQIAPLCQNSTTPALPATSSNNLTGTWSPSSINTSVTGTTTYTFTPSSGCATTTTMDITITTGVTPTFTQIGPLCQYATAPIFPATSNNNITGTWSPSTINTSATGTTTYTFTPSSGCATTARMDITISTGVTPAFTPIVPLCQNSTAVLPVTSNNNITGIWSPAAINTSTIGTTTYTFTPASGCATIATMDITINRGATPVRYNTLNIAANTNTQLQAREFTSADQHTWNPPVGLNAYSIRNPIFNYSAKTEYLISIVAGGGCTVVDTLLVNISPASAPPVQPADVFVPKAWSPNTDGHNDKLTPLWFRIKEMKYFRVFNRWEQLVFETKIMGEGWDGRFKGVPQGPDLFTWTVEAIDTDGRIHLKRGQSRLLR